jgi:motility quorum-sensing regulator/GCU-specific mRNA interferase toxin
MTEKRTPTYDLIAFKKDFSIVTNLNITFAAKRNASEIGFNKPDIVKVIQTMHREHFYKSMTSNANYKVWQDVYHVPSPVGVLYIKFTEETLTEFLLLSFKRRD